MATDTFSQWLDQAHVPVHTLTPEQRGLLHGAFHFRQHQGTVEPHKTEMWVRLLLRMAKKAAELGTDAMRSSLANGRTLEAMLHFLECDAGERSYFIERRNYFANMAYNPAAFA